MYKSFDNNCKSYSPKHSNICFEQRNNNISIKAYISSNKSDRIFEFLQISQYLISIQIFVNKIQALQYIVFFSY